MVRLPIPDSGRRLAYRAEARLGSLLAAGGHPVAQWTIVHNAENLCAVGHRLPGSPIEYGRRWPPTLAAPLGDLLADLHRLPVTDFGPLVDGDSTELTELTGIAPTVEDGIRARWSLARAWPFEGPPTPSPLDDHPVTAHVPDLVATIEANGAAILAAGSSGPIGLVHADLHNEHLLVDDNGRLAAVLDFGHAFIGATAWDAASLLWYYDDRDVAELAARLDGDAARFVADGRLLAVALGLYKLAKNGPKPTIVDRLRRAVGRLDRPTEPLA